MRIRILLLACSFFFLCGLVKGNQVYAQVWRTCCDAPGDDPTKCDACTNVNWKSNGSVCDTSVDPGCKICDAGRPIANACAPSGGTSECRYFSFAPSTLTIEEGSTATVTANVFATSLIKEMRFYSRDVNVVTLGPTHLATLFRNVCCGWTYGYFPGGISFVVNAEKPGTTTILGRAISSTSQICASAVMTVTVTPKATPTPTPVPTATPAGCSCGGWVNGACGTGGCGAGSYPQTRTCSPTACAAVTQCVSDPACIVATPTPTQTPLSSITSTIETDPSLTGGTKPQLTGGLLDPYCSSPDKGTAFSAGSVSAQNTATNTNYPGSINAAGTYTISNLPQASNAYCVKFTPNSPNIVCTCPTGCQYCGKTVPTTQNLKFYVSPVGNAWYQTVGGEVAAQRTNGTALSNPIPATCVEPFCKPYLSLPIGTETRSIGSFIGTKTGNVNLLSGSIGKAPDNRRVQLSSPLVCRENYDYFYRLYSMGLAPQNDFTYPADARKPTVAPKEDRAAYFYTGSGALTISSPWDLQAGESIVIFVDGNLKIANTITVAPGAFLSFIVSGTIDIDPSVGTSDHGSVSNGQVQGVYIANGAIRVLGVTGTGTEKKLIAEGTFAACNGIKIDRDFSRGGAGLDNNTYPGALFVYRPDFMKNTPERMKSSSFVWREVNP